MLEEVTTDEFARRLNQFKKLTRDFGESARSAFFALLSRPPTHGVATAGHADDLILDQIADWLVAIEKLSFPFTRFIDLSQLTTVAVRTSHVFKVARMRAQQFAGVWPVRTALFADDWVAFGIASMYESLMEDTLIEARAFRDLATAAEWLAVQVDVLRLKDEPAPHIGATSREVFGSHR